LGTAIVSYGGFQRYSVEVAALFDIDPEKYGQEVAGAPIKSLSELPSFLKENEIHLGIITVPAVVAQEVADILVANGVKAIWNFAPISLQVPAEVKVRNEDLAVGLATLCYFLNKENKKDAP
jgi:redox-sensing transcriptional repressor